MARPRLTPEQIAERDAERAAINANKRQRTIKINNTNSTPMSEQTEGQQNTVIDQQQNEQNQVQNNSTPPPAANTENTEKPQPNTTYKPFGAGTEDRNYATPQIDQNLAGGEIPEPTFDMPQVDITKTQSVDYLGTGTGAATNTQNPSSQVLPPNPALSQASPQEIRFAAEQMADTMIAGYDKAHALGRWFLKKSEEDLYEDHTEGKIDLSIELDMGSENGQKLSLGAFSTSFNEQIDQEFVVDQAWKDRVRPPLIRICEKNGWGMTDEQTIAFAVIEDVSTKVGLLIGLKKTYNKIYGMFAKIHEEKKKELEEAAEIIKAQRLEEARVQARLRAEEEAAIRKPQKNESQHSVPVSNENSKETMSAA